jgi:hypothetical protein
VAADRADTEERDWSSIYSAYEPTSPAVKRQRRDGSPPESTPTRDVNPYSTASSSSDATSSPSGLCKHLRRRRSRRFAFATNPQQPSWDNSGLLCCPECGGEVEALPWEQYSTCTRCSYSPSPQA